MRRGMLTTTSTVLAVMLIAGCGGAADNATPSRGRTAAPSASSAATPVPDASSAPNPTLPPIRDVTSPPQRPDTDRVDGKTAEAVCVYVFELFPYAFATGDLTEWRALSHPECVFCTQVIAEVEALVALGNHVEGGGTRVKLVPSASSPQGEFTLTGIVDEAPATQRSPTGDALLVTNGDRVTVTLRLTVQGGTWSVREVWVA